MTNEAKLFNEKYNLHFSDSQFKFQDTTAIKSEEISGIPRKNWKEVLIRYFTKPVYVIALAIFVLLILIAFIVPKISHWDSDLNIFKNIPDTVEGKNFIQNASRWIDKLPPTSKPFITKDLNNPAEVALFLPYADQIGFVQLDPITVRFNVWRYLELISVNSSGEQMFKAGTSILGTNNNGIDFWTRTWTGTSKSIILAILVAVTTTTIGMTIGSFIGLYVGSFIDILFMKILSVYNSIPTIVWYTVILFILPPGYLALFSVFVITGWMSGLGTARLYMWRYTNADFMKAAETIGVSKAGRIFKHALPHYFGFIAYGLVAQIPATINGESSLGFIGMSPNPRAASLGNVLNELRSQMSDFASRPMFILLPVIIIFTIALSLHFVAMGINDALDPRYKKR